LINILFLGGGRRVELAQRFIKRGYSIFSYESSFDVPIIEVATVLIGSNWKSSFIEIENIIREYNIDLVIPLQDEAVIIAACLRTDIPILVSDLKTAVTCFDKYSFGEFILNNFPEHYPIPKESQEVLFKPRFGYGSRDIFYKESYEWNNIPDGYIAQRKIKGIEYSVDSYFNKYGEWVDSVVRTRDRISGGEVFSSCIINNDRLRFLTKEINKRLGIKGPSNTQWIVDKDREWLLEINARFGGGYTFSMEAGLDAISLIEHDYFEGPAPIINIQYDLKLERSYRDHYFGTKNNGYLGLSYR